MCVRVTEAREVSINPCSFILQVHRDKNLSSNYHGAVKTCIRSSSSGKVLELETVTSHTGSFSGQREVTPYVDNKLDNLHTVMENNMRNEYAGIIYKCSHHSI